MKLETLDQLIALGHGDRRALDCIIVVKPKTLPDLPTLKLGAQRAQTLFPKTAVEEIRIIENISLNEFVNAALPSPFVLELAVIENDKLALKMSHLLGDGVSMLLWLKALLMEEVSTAAIEYKTYPAKKDTPYRKMLTSKIWPQKVTNPVHRRSFFRFSITHELCEHKELNDVMTLALLDSLPFKRKAIWLPVNVRKNFFEGFGNGLSRLRVYPPPGDAIKERLRHIRQQKFEAKTNGEIALPPSTLDLTSTLNRTILKAWIKRPWADWGSLSFSHLIDQADQLSSFENIWGISNIMPSHQVALFAVTQNQQTILTLTYDPEGVSDELASELMEKFSKRVKEIFNDLLA